MNVRHLPRAAVVVAAASLVTLGATAANADPVAPGGSTDIGVGVDIEARGELYMEVAPGDIVLTEDGSDSDARRFTGTLPEVTVTDTRTDAEVPPGVAWYVMGTASDLWNEAEDKIPAEYLGWVPEVIDNDGNPNITPGEEVENVIDGSGPGLVSQELLFWDVGAHTAGVYKASADLNLSTPVDVPGGLYTGTVTLSLFED